MRGKRALCTPPSRTEASFLPSFLPYKEVGGPWECARGSNVESIQKQEANVWKHGVQKPSGGSKEYWWQRVRATPGTTSNNSCLRQVPGDELGGPRVCPLFGSSQHVHHPAGLLVGSPEPQATLLSELSDRKSWEGLSEETDLFGQKERRTAGTKPTPADPGGSVEGQAGCLPCRVRRAGHIVLEGDTGASPGDLFLLEQPRTHSSHARTGRPKQSSLQGLLCTPTLSRQPGLGRGPELPRPMMGNLSKFEVLPKVGASQALCSLISSGARTR